MAIPDIEQTTAPQVVSEDLNCALHQGDDRGASPHEMLQIKALPCRCYNRARCEVAGGHALADSIDGHGPSSVTIEDSEKHRGNEISFGIAGIRMLAVDAAKRIGCLRPKQPQLEPAIG